MVLSYTQQQLSRAKIEYMGVRRHSHNIYLTKLLLAYFVHYHTHKLKKCIMVEYIFLKKDSFPNLHFNTLLHKT